MVWARDRVRGSASRLMAVTPCVRERLRRLRIDERLEQADDRLAARAACATSAADGFWTRSTTSAWLYSSAVETTVAPASV